MSATLVAPRPSEITARALASRDPQARFFDPAGRALQPRLPGPRFAQARFWAAMN